MRASVVTPAIRLMAFVCVGFTLNLAASSVRQSTSSSPGDTYASIATLPDWSGVWVIPFEAFARENARERVPGSSTGPILTPEEATKRAALAQRILSGDGQSNVLCVPGGMPSVMRFAFGVEFLFTPGRVTMLLEQGPTIRRIYTDGRTHTSDPDLTYAGESIGHWEGETLVVDTTGITPRARITNGVYGSGKTRIVERIHLADRTHLQIDTVVEDPLILQAPWRHTRIYERSDSGWFERYCDNNRDGNDAEPDLTPPK
jgi:hypothetical protein